MKDDIVFLKHIIDEINYIVSKTKELDYDVLLQDETLKRAILRSLEIIGEASKNLSNDFKGKYPKIQWKEMAGLRDKLIHDYFGVDWDIVWDVVKNELPITKNELDHIDEKV